MPSPLPRAKPKLKPRDIKVELRPACQIFGVASRLDGLKNLK
jgi:hypothetical protein